MSDISRIAADRSTLLEFLDGQPGRCLLVDGLGNTGDQLIKAGTKALLDSAGMSYEPVSPDLQVAGAASKTLLVRGSGGWCTHFHGFMPALVERAAPQFASVIVLPSGFDASAPGVASSLGHPNVIALSRDLVSADAVRGLAAGFASVDCAMHHPRLAGGASKSGRGTLVALRTDRGSALPNLGLQPHPTRNLDISTAIDDVNEWIDLIEAAAVVVTDRLHVAVAAALLGKSMALLDPYDHKLSAYFAYTFGTGLDDRVSWHDEKWLKVEGLAVAI